MHGYVVEQQVNVERKICKTRGVGGGGDIKVYIRFLVNSTSFFKHASNPNLGGVKLDTSWNSK